MNKRLAINACIYLSVMGFVACGGKQTAKDTISTETVENSQSANAETATDTANAPVMTFEKEKYEFGKIIQGEKVSFSFKFTNTGKTDLLISSSTASCGCTVPTYSKTPVKPGENGKIDVVFDSDGKKGTVTKHVTVLANTNPNSKVLELSGEILVPAGSEQK